VIDTFKEDLERNPVSAFSWSQQAFLSAAKLEAFKSVVSTLADPSSTATIKSLHSYYYKQAMMATLNPPSSTSPTSNLIKQYQGAAAAEVMELLEVFVNSN
jgi:hypothetical protein